MAATLRKAALYWHTLRHLKPVQIIGRLRHRLSRPVPELGPAPALRAAPGSWQLPARRAPSLTGPDGVVFLNAPGSLAEGGWDDPARAKLWRYNLHYFDDLNARDAAARDGLQRVFIAAWLVGNPPGLGSGWEPYPTSLRIVNWVKWLAGGAAPPYGMLDSLAVQARWLMRNLEWHLLGNHLFVNAKALVFAGCFFDGPEALLWLRQGTRILMDEVPEQILPDGGQFELTPMYHALALEDVLDLVNVLTRAGDVAGETSRLLALLRARVAPMQDWLAALSHPDGDIAFFNDAALGIAPETAELTAYAARLGFAPPARPGAALHLPDSGFARLSGDGEDTVVLADLAEVGPTYLPGHAHADTLSFECSILGQRVIVNSGTSEYGLGAERLRQRGTPAHSTVTVAGQDSSEVWAGFRVARRAHVQDVRVAPGTISARHDGYRRLSPPVDHQRDWALQPGRLTVTDRVTAGVPAEARYHLHPGVQAGSQGPLDGILTLPDGRQVRWQAQAAAVRLEPGSWHPRFGQSQPNTCLVLSLDDGAASLTLSWA